MSETTPTTEGTASTSAGTEGEAPGALGTTPPASTGAQPDAGALANQLEAANRRARDEQSRADRLAAQLAALDKSTAPDPQPTATPGLTLEQMRAELRRDREFALTESTLRGEFASADAGLFSNPVDRFDSVEAFRAAVEESHRSIEERVAARAAAQEQELRAKYAEKYGPLEPDVPDASVPAGDGIPTLAQVQRMTLAQQDALEAANPGVIDRIIETASRREG